jgi:eukaryotic-like serine/threonine-protein kinase
MRLLAPPAPAMGELIDGKYRVISLIGEGGMGTVLAAHHELLDVRVAVKLLSPTLARHRPLADRFLREAQAAARLKSEHVARVLDVGTLEGGEPYLVMDLLEGEDLEQRLQRVGRMAIADAVDCALQALEAMAHAHAVGIVHRDLKPANLFAAYTPDGREVIKVLDFGIAKLNDAAAGAGSRSGALTDDHATLGSPSYMAPEQVRASRVVDQRADIWALGTILYELMTGRVAFGGQSVGVIFGAVLHEKAQRLRTLRPDAPLELEAVIDRCLERDPKHRFADVSDLANALAPFGSGSWAGHVERIQQTLARAGKVSSDITSPGWSPNLPQSIRVGPRLSAPDHLARSAAAAETLAGEPTQSDERLTPRLSRRSPTRVIMALAALVVALSCFLLFGSKSSQSSSALLPEVPAPKFAAQAPPTVATTAPLGPPLPDPSSSASATASSSPAAASAPRHGRTTKPSVRSAPPTEGGRRSRKALPGVLDSPD